MAGLQDSTAAREAIWSEVLGEVKSQVDEQSYNLWLGHLELTQFDDARVVIGVPNLIIQEGVESRFRHLFLQAFEKRCGPIPDLRIAISGELYRKSRDENLKVQQEIIAEGAQAREGRPVPDLNRNYRLQNFVEGPCNRLAVACALDLIQDSGGRFRPLFIHSKSGLGKTHLLQAVWWAVREQGDGRTIEYVPAEAFTNQYVYAVRRRKFDAFRAKYRNVDLLLIDDVHFFSDKPGLQDEFLHTFDALVGEDRQVVLASDAHPKALRRLKEGLISRFAAGMVVSVGRPDFSTRVGILERKAEESRCRVGQDVIEFLAKSFDKNVRELCGVLMTVVAYARLAKKRVDLGLAREALNAVNRHMARVIDLELIEEIVGRRYNVTREELHSGRRTRSIALPRQVCMFLGRELTNLSCVQIARHFGGRHHTTVVFSQRRVRQILAQDPDFVETLDDLRRALVDGGNS